MDTARLETTVKQMIARPKGLLAADESTNSANKRLEAVRLEQTQDNRYQFRELLITTPDLNQYISGIILFDETFRQQLSSGKLVPEYLKDNNILAGIKVDSGLAPLPGHSDETTTKGLDTLAERVAEYESLGATFTKWRSVIKIGQELPSQIAVKTNASVLAQYARICQDAGLVPMVEPEVLYDGNHTIERASEVMHWVYTELFNALSEFQVYLPGTILKTSFVVPGKDSSENMSSEQVADLTLQAIYDFVPRELGGVVFLSGGQSPKDSFNNLAALHRRPPKPHPQGLTFSYSRALQDPVLHTWADDTNKVTKAQEVFLKQLKIAQQALEGVGYDLDVDDFVTVGQD